MTAFEALARLADLAGVETCYEDAWGTPQELSRERVEALLALFGISTASDEDVHAAIDDWESRPWRRPLPPVQVVRQGAVIEIPLVRPVGQGGDVAWRVMTEDGAAHEGRAKRDDLPVAGARRIGGCEFERRTLRLPLDLPMGYHALHAAECEMTLIVVPRKCYVPPSLADGKRSWGFAVQLYGLRSGRNWGIGDFTDLAALVEGAHALGAGVVGVNPLHAGFIATPERVSPYEPTSRLFLNVLYLDVERVPDYAECHEAQHLVASPEFQERLAALRSAPLVDYPDVAQCKLEVLRVLYRSFSDRHLRGQSEAEISERGRAFRRFQRDRGEPLRTQALFDALAERFASGKETRGHWPEWPEGCRHPRAPGAAGFLQRSPQRVEFYEYLQWLVANQIHAVGERCEELGLDVGLYLDLAIGVARDGADVWADQDAYIAAATVGAPPDIWNPKGQDWGLPPFNPHVMRERAYAPLSDVLAANMRHAGALRIDHVLGLLHLYWIPHGGSPADGGFVSYPFEDLLGIVALESHRNRCLVIGEDLGTVPRELKQRLQDCGVLSYRLLYFEQDEEGRFISPEDYPRLALASTTTHDLPTLPGYWAGHDLKLRSRLNLFPSRRHEREAHASRERDRIALLDALRRDGLLTGAADELPEFTTDLPSAAYVFLARSPAMILMVNFEDVLGQKDQPNLPGTVDQHPNWQRKLPASLSDLLADRRVVVLATRIEEVRAAPAKAL